MDEVNNDNNVEKPVEQPKEQPNRQPNEAPRNNGRNNRRWKKNKFQPRNTNTTTTQHQNPSIQPNQDHSSHQPKICPIMSQGYLSSGNARIDHNSYRVKDAYQNLPKCQEGNCAFWNSDEEMCQLANQ